MNQEELEFAEASKHLQEATLPILQPGENIFDAPDLGQPSVGEPVVYWEGPHLATASVHHISPVHWGDDLRIEMRSLHAHRVDIGTGCKAWPGSIRFARWICLHAHDFLERDIIELGSGGTSLPGVTAALFAREVIMSDCVDSVVQKAQEHIRINHGILARAPLFRKRASVDMSEMSAPAGEETPASIRTHLLDWCEVKQGITKHLPTFTTSPLPPTVVVNGDPISLNGTRRTTVATTEDGERPTGAKGGIVFACETVYEACDVGALAATISALLLGPDAANGSDAPPPPLTPPPSEPPFNTTPSEGVAAGEGASSRSLVPSSSPVAGSVSDSVSRPPEEEETSRRVPPPPPPPRRTPGGGCECAYILFPTDARGGAEAFLTAMSEQHLHLQTCEVVESDGSGVEIFNSATNDPPGVLGSSCGSVLDSSCGSVLDRRVDPGQLLWDALMRSLVEVVRKPAGDDSMEEEQVFLMLKFSAI